MSGGYQLRCLVWMPESHAACQPCMHCMHAAGMPCSPPELACLAAGKLSRYRTAVRTATELEVVVKCRAAGIVMMHEAGPSGPGLTPKLRQACPKLQIACADVLHMCRGTIHKHVCSGHAHAPGINPAGMEWHTCYGDGIRLRVHSCCLCVHFSLDCCGMQAWMAYKCTAQPWVYRLLSLGLAAFSISIVWSEATIGFGRDLSPFSHVWPCQPLPLL